ncbi:MAG: alpha/beta hydrolase [Ruminococcaceae bacterium]|nr:alpha/beta hydrolase [Oscillospiraceae bacterium]
MTRNNLLEGDCMLAGVYHLWDFECEPENPMISYYKPEEKISDWSVVIFPGGGYSHRAEHEGKGYAEFLNANGIAAFVVDYRVSPNRFPAELSDARRGIRFVRNRAEEFGIRKDKIAVMGSSAGGHLAALVSNYKEELPGEPFDIIDEEDYLPNAQILCYPVIRVTPDFGHTGSGKNLLGEDYEKLAEQFNLDGMVTEHTPPAFIWHTFNDGGVSVLNSLSYTEALYRHKVPTELHVFPEGPHGLGLANAEPRINPHVAQWSELLIQWMKQLS